MSDPPDYPSMQQLRDAQPPISQLPGQLGLIWPLTGPLTAILIKQGDNPPTPYCTIADNNITQYHPLANAPLTDPKISSITVTVDELNQWEDVWLDDHEHHHSPDHSPSDDFEYQSFPDWDPEQDEGEVQLVKCCGEARPRNTKVSLIVTAAPNGDGFVTLRDYLSAVHPWLVGMREDLKTAYNVTSGGEVESAMELSVCSTALDELSLETELNMSPPRGMPVTEDAEAVVYGRRTEWPSADEHQANLRRMLGDQSISIPGASVP